MAVLVFFTLRRRKPRFPEPPQSDPDLLSEAPQTITPTVVTTATETPNVEPSPIATAATIPTSALNQAPTTSGTPTVPPTSLDQLEDAPQADPGSVIKPAIGSEGPAIVPNPPIEAAPDDTDSNQSQGGNL